MPTRESPTEVKEPESPFGSATGSAAEPEGSPSDSETGSHGRATSRWIDYDTHELLEMISDLEDERRWARLREGVLWAILFHLAIILALFLLPRYIKMPPVMEANAHDKSNFTYLDSPQWKPKAPVKPLIKPPVIDKQTLDEMKRETPPAPKIEEPQPPQQQVQEQPKPAPVIPPTPQSPSLVEAPRPSANPARPSFAMNNSNPADQLKRDMENAMHNHGGAVGEQGGSSGLSQHPGAGTGAPQILSDTQGVDFSSWMARWHYETQKTWDPLIPDEVNAPINKSGMVVIRFKVLPNGRLMDGSVMLEGRSGDTALDRAAWGALVGSNYPPLPREFHGAYLELRAFFFYNMQPSGQ